MKIGIWLVLTNYGQGLMLRFESVISQYKT
jgi:hypothetical protein